MWRLFRIVLTNRTYSVIDMISYCVTSAPQILPFKYSLQYGTVLCVSSSPEFLDRVIGIASFLPILQVQQFSVSSRLLFCWLYGVPIIHTKRRSSEKEDDVVVCPVVPLSSSRVRILAVAVIQSSQ